METCQLKGFRKQLLHLKELYICESMEASCLQRSGHTVPHNSLEAFSFWTYPVVKIPPIFRTLKIVKCRSSGMWHLFSKDYSIVGRYSSIHHHPLAC